MCLKRFFFSYQTSSSLVERFWFHLDWWATSWNSVWETMLTSAKQEQCSTETTVGSESGEKLWRETQRAAECDETIVLACSKWNQEITWIKRGIQCMFKQRLRERLMQGIDGSPVYPTCDRLALLRPRPRYNDHTTGFYAGCRDNF